MTIKRGLLFAFIAAVSIQAAAQDVKISGTVTDTIGGAISGARLNLAVIGYFTISDSKGNFTISGTTGILGPKSLIGSEMPVLYGNDIRYTIATPTRVQFSVCAMNGKTVGTMFDKTVEKGAYSFTPSFAGFGSGTYLVKAQIGRTTTAFRLPVFDVGAVGVGSGSVPTIESTRLAKVSAITDTIIAFKIGYIMAKKSISSYTLANQTFVLAAALPNRPNVAPGGNIDLSIWSLQLPTGSGTSPTTINPNALQGENGFSDANYFYTASDGAMTFMDPQQGITTSGSVHCRTELREMTSSGSAAAWAWNGTNTMTVTGEVVQVGGGAGGNVTLGQVFNNTNSIPLCEFQYNANGNAFKAFYEEAKGGGSTTDLKTSCALKTKYTFSLSLSSGVLTVSINGNQVYSKTPTYSGKQFYFKCGCYDQTATAGSPSTTPYTIVKVYSLDVEHTP